MLAANNVANAKVDPNLRRSAWSSGPKRACAASRQPALLGSRGAPRDAERGGVYASHACREECVVAGAECGPSAARESPFEPFPWALGSPCAPSEGWGTTMGGGTAPLSLPSLTWSRGPCTDRGEAPRSSAATRCAQNSCTSSTLPMNTGVHWRRCAGWSATRRSRPLTAAPPACSTRKAKGAASWTRLSLPLGLPRWAG
mmetsp:Transcript_20601/g.69146  ORF Transcript_20601/g.69146 Transcript_20601/m.69146 type:complete len:200 (-) Transcript_20601:1068-1667(-)